MSISSQQLEKHLPLFTERLLLRQVQTSDAEDLFNTYTSDPEVTKNASWPTHTTVQETETFIQKSLEKWHRSEEFNMCICLQDQPSRPIGMCKIRPSDTAIHLGYVLAKKYWNRGFTTEVVTHLCQLLFTFPDIIRIEAFTDPSNAASITVLKKAGFRLSHRIAQHIVRPQLSSKPRDSLVFSLLKN